MALFPQLVAGPIVRYRTVAEQLHSRTHSLAKFAAGVLAFQSGLAKKVLIADVLAPVADAAFQKQGLGFVDAWVGRLAYTFQIYFDFSGYSDMAIGLGLMIGFRFPVNFNRPWEPVANSPVRVVRSQFRGARRSQTPRSSSYRGLGATQSPRNWGRATRIGLFARGSHVSRSITEFWRRWHISLSAFLRDYLYLPLGGNRRSPGRTYVNLAIVMLLGGLWHGAAWTFVAWGAYQGFWLIVERAAGKRPLYAKLPSWLAMGMTFLLVVFGWVLFRAPSMGAALDMWRSMLTPSFGSASQLPVGSMQLTAFAASALVTWGCRTTQDLVPRAPRWWALGMQVLFVISLLHIQYQEHVPFLYFQF